MTNHQLEIATVLAAHPDLCIEGFRTPGEPDFAERREKLAQATDEFGRAVTWLGLIPRVGTAPAWSSYYLKHICEGWAGAYVSNGALIAAALSLGIKVRHRGHNDNPYVALASTKKWPTAAHRQHLIAKETAWATSSH